MVDNTLHTPCQDCIILKNFELSITRGRPLFNPLPAHSRHCVCTLKLSIAGKRLTEPKKKLKIQPAPLSLYRRLISVKLNLMCNSLTFLAFFRALCFGAVYSTEYRYEHTYHQSILLSHGEFSNLQMTKLSTNLII